MRAFILGVDCESFGKSVLESGMDSSSRSLPIILEMQRAVSVGSDNSGAAGQYNKKDQSRLTEDAKDHNYVANPAAKYIAVDTYVCSDGWFFFNSDGSVTPSV